jgi:predicted glycogen debranching enzyme
MLPNRFPDGGEAPEYNTVDATLWYFHAIDAYLDSTGGDRALLRDLYPALREILDWHRRGTRYGVRVDTADGLLHAGERGVQLTWMDAKIGDWVVTPRIGKPVEINALWHFALDRMAKWSAVLGDKRAATELTREAARVAASFAKAFWFADGGYLFDVVDSADDEIPSAVNALGQRSDASLRPNQIFAVTLAPELLDDERARAVVATCARHLVTPVGLRSLALSDPRFAARYQGGPRERDGVYHQGTVWSWLTGPFALAHYRAFGNATHSLALLEGMGAHLGEACLGTISEIFDGQPPYTPRGCFAQAWSVSETLRAWHALTNLNSRAERSRLVQGISP